MFTQRGPDPLLCVVEGIPEGLARQMLLLGKKEVHVPLDHLRARAARP